MITIIICSARRHLLDNAKENIRRTIGVPYEIISIDNSNNQFGICSAYNNAGRQAKYPILCFMHEDIFFETDGWGKIACFHLSDPKTGLIGVAGGDIKSLVPSSWSIPMYSREINIIQHYSSDEKKPNKIVETNSVSPSSLKNVTVLDGVWMCTRKDIFDQYKFDESTFSGFHGYDLDYSLQIGLKYEVKVLFEITIHHYSEGKPDLKWMESAIALSKKWKSILPKSVHALTTNDLRQQHWEALHIMLIHLFRLRYPNYLITLYFFRYAFTRFFTLRKFLSQGKFIMISILKQASIYGPLKGKS
jgi:hypothetical protein